MRAFVADSCNGADTGLVHVVDLNAEAVIESIVTGHNPDIAVSGDGQTICITYTDLRNDPCGGEIAVYDGNSLSEIARAGFSNRMIYNVAPTGHTLVISPDARCCFVAKAHIVASDQAEYSLAVFNLQALCFESQEIKLPEDVFHIESVVNPAGLCCALDGRHLCYVGEVNGPFGSLMERLRFVSRNNRLDFSLAAMTVDSEGRFTYCISREGKVYVVDRVRGLLSEPNQIDLGEENRVPLQQAGASASTLYIGMADAETASRGESSFIHMCSISKSLCRERAITPGFKATQFRVVPSEDRLLCMSRRDRALVMLDAHSNTVIRKVVGVGNTPVFFDMSSD